MSASTACALEVTLHNMTVCNTGETMNQNQTMKKPAKSEKWKHDDGRTPKRKQETTDQKMNKHLTITLLLRDAVNCKPTALLLEEFVKVLHRYRRGGRGGKI